MDFFFKKSKIVVDCFTTNLNAYNLFPVQKTSEFIPEWWKKMPKFFDNTLENGMEIKSPTIKKCPGIIDLYRKGFVVPMWVDMVIETHPQTKEYRYWSADGGSWVSNHPPQQIGGDFSNHVNIKFNPPWSILEKTGVQFLYIRPIYNNLSFNWQLMPGVIDFKYQWSTNINIIAPNDTRISFEAGTPLVQVVPLSEKEVVIKNHVVDDNDKKMFDTLNKRRVGINHPFSTSIIKKGKAAMAKVESAAECPYTGKKKWFRK